MKLSAEHASEEAGQFAEQFFARDPVGLRLHRYSTGEIEITVSYDKEERAKEWIRLAKKVSELESIRSRSPDEEYSYYEMKYRLYLYDVAMRAVSRTADAKGILVYIPLSVIPALWEADKLMEVYRQIHTSR